VTLGRRELDALLVDHGLEPSRALGQNFVADPNTVRRIARLAGVGPGDRVLEIGAGLGSLSLALAETGASVTAVEVDRHLEPVLRSVVEPAGVRVVLADAMTADWPSILDGGAGGGGDPGGGGPDEPGWSLVANLPYNVATPLVLDLLDGVAAIRSMLVLVQLEVAERLAAPPGTRTFGLPSLKVAYWATAEVVGTVPASVFIPRPRVESALVRIVRRDRPAVGGDPDALFALARQAFSQRRKMLRRSLAGVADAAVFDAAAVAPDARPEVLDLAAWARLRDAVVAAEVAS
jgi:16S rRNA (adenine1518-N6/adenine1519-N6)-dimethyltransferase